MLSNVHWIVTAQRPAQPGSYQSPLPVRGSAIAWGELRVVRCGRHCAASRIVRGEGRGLPRREGILNTNGWGPNRCRWHPVVVECGRRGRPKGSKNKKGTKASRGEVPVIKPGKRRRKDSGELAGTSFFLTPPYTSHGRKLLGEFTEEEHAFYAAEHMRTYLRTCQYVERWKDAFRDLHGREPEMEDMSSFVVRQVQLSMQLGDLLRAMDKQIK